MKPGDAREKALDLHDAAIDALRRIEAMAGLMRAAAGGWAPDPPLEVRGIEEAAGIICEETAKVRGALDSMRGLVDCAKARARPSHTIFQ